MRPTLVILLLASLVSSAHASFNCEWNTQHKGFGPAAQCTAFCKSCCAQFPKDEACLGGTTCLLRRLPRILSGVLETEPLKCETYTTTSPSPLFNQLLLLPLCV
ncbi:hypothetical protein DFH09DRAFT_1366407 [Mycena vulgaris]|nr:hypothetical protein DFH09DRAFT_1366407 [Mycena vulgaris]